jgi:phosphogluconate dehydratase
MSGASGKVPAAIHLSPEAVCGGNIAKIRNGDMLRLDANTGELVALVDDAEWQVREVEARRSLNHRSGTGRELFGFMRNQVCGAEQGATVFQDWD